MKISLPFLTFEKFSTSVILVVAFVKVEKEIPYTFFELISLVSLASIDYKLEG